jgi:hypothetical protein
MVTTAAIEAMRLDILSPQFCRECIQPLENNFVRLALDGPALRQ